MSVSTEIQQSLLSAPGHKGTLADKPIWFRDTRHYLVYSAARVNAMTLLNLTALQLESELSAVAEEA
jgi:hypothetical protein